MTVRRRVKQEVSCRALWKGRLYILSRWLKVYSAVSIIQHYLPISGARQCFRPTWPGCSLYYASDVVSPRPVISRHSRLFSTVASPGKLGKVSHGTVSASSSGSVPRAPAPPPRSEQPGEPARRGGPETRSGPALRRPPGAASPTFSRQEGGRPRAFPVVQLKWAETSLHSHSLGCQRTRGQSSGPSRAGGARRARARWSGLLGRAPAPGARTARTGCGWAPQSSARRPRGEPLFLPE